MYTGILPYLLFCLNIGSCTSVSDVAPCLGATIALSARGGFPFLFWGSGALLILSAAPC